MMRLLGKLLLFSFCGITPLSAADGIWSSQGNSLPRERAVIPVNGYFADPQEKQAGFFLRLGDMRTAADRNFRLSDTAAKELLLAATPGDYYTAALTFLPIRDLKGKVQITVSDFRNSGGKTIPAGSFRLLEALEVNKRKMQMTTAPLVDPLLADMKKGQVVQLVFFADIPRNTPAGIYQGIITAAGSSGKVTLQAALNVMPFELPALQEGFGYYMPGHYHKALSYPDPTYRHRDPGTGRYLDKGIRGYDDLLKLFKFYRSRRFNSVNLFQVLGELKYENGKVTGSFPELSQFAKAMKASGMDGKLAIDLRYITFWCDHIAIQERKKAGLPVEKGFFQSDVNKYFEPALKLLLEIAEKEKFPPFVLLTSEEVSNDARKKAEYYTFIKTLMRICPDKTYVLDNDIGYNRPDAIDRGAADKVRFRQYNSWTDKGLADAKKDGAEVWSYNYGHGRIASGLLQEKLNSKLHNQWADQWTANMGNPDVFWRNAMVTPDGIITSLSVENFHNGRLDLAAIRLLQSTAAACGPADLKAAQEFIRGLLTEVPVDGNSFRSYQEIASDQSLNMIRWKIFCEIRRLQLKRAGKTVPQPAIPAGISPAVRYIDHGRSIQKSENNRIVSALYVPEPAPLLSAEGRRFFGKGTGALKYIVSQENRIRSVCSSEEEFRRQYTPSYGEGFFYYSGKGLYFSLHANHMRPGGSCRFRRQNDDPNLWQDDCFELFILPPGEKEIFRMTVNVAGNITFFRGNKVIPSAKIERRLKTPYNKTGGVQIEGVIPWEYFKLNGMPVKGSSWKFNLGREFRALNQTTSFGRVINLFNELEHWGELFFSGATPFDNFVTVAPTVLYQGNSNAITGSVKSISNRNFTVEILNSRDIRVGKTTVKSNKRFWIPINVEKQDEGKNFTVNLLDNGKFMEKAVIPVGSLHPSVLIRRFEKLYSGDKEIIFACDVKLPAGTRNGRMRCLFDNGKQKFESLVNIPREGTIELKFSANTLPPGRYRLFCWVDKLDYRDANPSVEFEILPSRRAAL